MFYDSKVSIMQVFDLMYCFAERKSLAEVSAETGVSLNTASNYFSKFRHAAIKYESWADSKIGGNGDIVEMDETHIYSCKYSRGRVLKGQKYWVLGAISRDTKRAKLFVTTKRSMPVINRFTHDNVVEGTHIMTDEWRGYNELQKNGFPHSRINHTLHYIDPNEKSIHTNTIERLWRSLKEFVGQNLTLSDLTSKFQEFEKFHNLKAKGTSQRLIYSCACSTKVI